MHREKRNSQNEPTVAHSGTLGCIRARKSPPAVDTGLRQLTPVDTGLPISRFGKTNPPRPESAGSCDTASSSLLFSARFRAKARPGFRQKS
jgi:hypothetical protein